MTDPDDPKGLIREIFRMEVGLAECRSLLVDWALSLPAGADTGAALARLLDRHGTADHPMVQVLRDGLGPAPAPVRRGGRAGRFTAPDAPPRPPVR